MTVSEVDAVAHAFHDGVANRNAAALASLYAENGRFLPPEAVTDVGTYVVVHQRQADGSTKILYDIFNSNTPGG
jgi:ketosteroid isomerase-like protein